MHKIYQSLIWLRQGLLARNSIQPTANPGFMHESQNVGGRLVDERYLPDGEAAWGC